MVSPEQSNASGPTPAYTYFSPIWAFANSIALCAAGLGAGMLVRSILVLPPEPKRSLGAHLEWYGELPATSPALLAEVERSGLRGKGGARFPTATKLRAVAAGRRAVVVANGTEGEPASLKDTVLTTHAPHLVLDGAGGNGFAQKFPMIGAFGMLVFYGWLAGRPDENLIENLAVTWLGNSPAVRFFTMHTLDDQPALRAASMNLRRATAMSHASGLSGTPLAGQSASAAAKASDNASSAPATSRVRAASKATSLP